MSDKSWSVLRWLVIVGSVVIIVACIWQIVFHATMLSAETCDRAHCTDEFSSKTTGCWYDQSGRALPGQDPGACPWWRNHSTPTLTVEQSYEKIALDKFASASIIEGVPNRAETVGQVQNTQAETDGDMHIRVCHIGPKAPREEIAKRCIIAECTIAQPCEKPKMGAVIVVRGLTRYDYGHKHWELHPLDSWEVKP